MNDDCSAEGGTIMKKYIFFIFFIFYSSQFAYSAQPYLEGQLGVGMVEDVSGSTIVRTGGFNVAVGVDDLSYDSGLLFGGEFGFKNIGQNSNLRMGLGISTFEAEFEDGTITAGTTFNGVAVSVSTAFTAADAAAVGVTLDNDVTLFGLNTYLDIPTTNSGFTPYIGIGLGFADIENAEDNEFAASFLFGGNYKITDNAYIGAKGAYHNIFGPTDEAGIEYDDINAWTFNIALGIEF